MFDGIVVSGEEKMVKPNPEIYQLLLNRYHLQASESIFIDDRPANVEEANHVGIHGILFKGSLDLKLQVGACLWFDNYDNGKQESNTHQGTAGILYGRRTVTHIDWYVK